YFGQDPAIHFTYNVAGHTFESIGSINGGYSYVYLQLPTRYLFEVTGYTDPAKTRYVSTAFDLWDYNGDALSYPTPLASLPDRFPNTEVRSFYYVNCKSPLFSTSDCSTLFVGSVKSLQAGTAAIPEPTTTLGMVVATGLGLFWHKQRSQAGGKGKLRATTHNA
ncbi:MAG: PEP-CTERM sorting domain-containing protein, partial [Cyanobacteria bacterium]|nr:PEP-CTERM sorting domain-containing protein [Cyanobacteriota bacterium]MDW8202328.1 PEP-CTERM sorting domain-containing protein [Cyanobacteriota bacterium SKYGB_h_bin112]